TRRPTWRSTSSSTCTCSTATASRSSRRAAGTSPRSVRPDRRRFETDRRSPWTMPRGCTSMTIPRTASSSTSSALLRAALVAAAVAVLAGVPVAAQAPSEPPAQAGASMAAAPELAEAKRLFDALETAQALALRARAIALFEREASPDPCARDRLIAAREMRARARFGLGNQEGAESASRLLLTHDPAFEL